MFAVLRQFQHGIFALLGLGLAWLGWRWWRKRQSLAAAAAATDSPSDRP
jgi:predicted negative regulator of RcsB-dependent stress response